MAKNVFISFRYEDGHLYKEKLDRLFDNSTKVINYSEKEDRSNKSEQNIKEYLYAKLRETSVTIVILTPKAINHEKVGRKYDDWMYDEIRYSLENRSNNRRNALIAVYTDDAEKIIFENDYFGNRKVRRFKNLVYENMNNLKDRERYIPGIKLDKDYCTLVSWKDFTSDINYYIDHAIKKRENSDKYIIRTRMTDEIVPTIFF